jgi:spermidine/putrescine transport system substrate-binding protein
MKRITLLALLACFFYSCNSSKEDTLFLFTWSEFFDSKLIEKFEEEFQCRVVIDTYDSNESMYAKLKLGSSSYDLIFPSGYYLEILNKQGLTAPLDKSQIPNIANLDPSYFDKNAPLIGVPFLVSFSGIAYRKDRVSLEPTWGAFARSDLRGRMTVLNDIREALGAALKFLGYSVNTRNPKELEEAGNVLIQWKPNLAKFESEQYKSGIATAEFLVVQGYSIDIMQIRQEDENVDFLFPKEGAIMSIDYIAMLKGSKHKDLAYAFINFMLDPNNAAQNMTYTKSLMPVKNAYELLDPVMKESPILFPTQENLSKMEEIKDVQEDIKYYFETWERVKGS